MKGAAAGVLGKIAAWVPSKSRGITVLFLSNRWLKLLSTRGSGNVTTLLAKQIEGMGDQEILHWLQETAQARGLEPASVLLANPSHLTTARLFTLPSTDPKEIRDIVGLQVEKHTPYAKEDILTDFRVLEGDRSGYSRVLLVISHKDVVHRGLSLVEGLGWPLERVGFELEGLVNWFLATQGKLSKEVILLGELDSDTATLVVLQNGKPYFHRSLPLGTSQLEKEGPEGTKRLVTEFQQTLETFKAEGFNVSVSRVVLTGKVESLTGIEGTIQQEMNLPTTIVGSFGEHFRFDPAMKEEEKEMGSLVSFSSLLGLASGLLEVDLTPVALKLHRTFEIRARALVGLGTKLIAGLLLVSCLIVGKAHQNVLHHTVLLKEFRKTAEKTQTLEFSLEKLDLIHGWARSGGRLLSALASLGEQTPAQIRWSSMTFREEEGIVIKGTSQAAPKVFDFVKTLERSPWFSEVEARRVAQRKVNEKDVTEFEIVCSLVEPLAAQLILEVLEESP